MNTKRVEILPDVPFSRAELLTAGNLSAIFEEGNIRYIKYHGEEITRMIYPAIRDENWKTIYPRISDMVINKEKSSFSVRYRALFDEGNVKFNAEFIIEGGPDDSISFTMKGEALKPFRSKRVGLCMLHPVYAAAGRPVSVTSPGGEVSEKSFPASITPVPPFTDVKAMEWTTPTGISLHIDFDGDVFETEDQRNWGDNSYKTYSGPQYCVSMVQYDEGQRMEQRISLRVGGGVPARSHAAAEERKLPLPSVGYCRNPQKRRLSDAEVMLAASIPFDHYRVELHLRNPAWKDVLKAACEESVLLKVKLELVLFFYEGLVEEKTDYAQTLEACAHTIGSVLILYENHSTPPAQPYNIVYRTLKNSLPGIAIGYGTDVWFAELNSKAPLNVDYDFISFPYNPQVHLNDSRTILENLEGIQAIVSAARIKAPADIVHLSPVTLDERPERDTAGIEMRTAPDERMHTWFGCWWMLRMIYGPGSANLVTIFDLTGGRGIIDTTRQELSPLFQALKMIKEFQPVCVIHSVETGHNDKVPGAGSRLVFENAKGDRLYFTF